VSERQRNPRGQGERLRDALLDAAATIVVDAGNASGLSLRSVAARVGVAATSVYLHFKDIDALKVALADRCFASFAAFRDRAADGIDDPRAALSARCGAYVRWAVDNPGYYRLMFGADVPPLMDDPAGEESRAAFGALVASVARVAPAGEDPTRLAVLVWSALHGQATLRMDRPHFPWPPLEETVTDLVRRIVGFA
jgi:AcrR family transcriptional regulator